MSIYTEFPEAVEEIKRLKKENSKLKEQVKILQDYIRRCRP